MFDTPPVGEALEALKTKFALVGGDSRALAQQYLDKELSVKFPETRT